MTDFAHGVEWEPILKETRWSNDLEIFEVRVSRLRVPGGYLYKYEKPGTGVSITFVPK